MSLHILKSHRWGRHPSACHHPLGEEGKATSYIASSPWSSVSEFCPHRVRATGHRGLDRKRANPTAASALCGNAFHVTENDGWFANLCSLFGPVLKKIHWFSLPTILPSVFLILWPFHSFYIHEVNSKTVINSGMCCDLGSLDFMCW